MNRPVDHLAGGVPRGVGHDRCIAGEVEYVARSAVFVFKSGESGCDFLLAALQQRCERPPGGGRTGTARGNGSKSSVTLMAAVHGRNYDSLASFVRNTAVSTPITPLAVQHQGVHMQLLARSGCSA
jgi:hypothetical protein